jgi:hypothetical protein
MCLWLLQREEGTPEHIDCGFDAAVKGCCEVPLLIDRAAAGRRPEKAAYLDPLLCHNGTKGVEEAMVVRWLLGVYGQAYRL